MKLRAYQEEAVDAVQAEFDAGRRSTLLVCPTGGGKTIMFGELIRRLHKDRRAMVLAHREELIFQACDKIARVTGETPAVEMADQFSDEGALSRARIVVSTIQTQITGRFAKFDPTEFGLVIADEAHHAVAESWTKVINHYLGRDANGDEVIDTKCNLLGVTATPDRTDEEALGQMFETCAYRYEIADAIRDGWLVPVSIRQIVVEGLSYDTARVTAGDLNQGDVARIQSNEATLHAIVSPVIGEAKWKRTLVFCAPGYLKVGDGKENVIDEHSNEIHIADRVCEILNRHKPGIARRVHQGTPKDERRQTLADFAAGRFQFCVNVGVLTEGFDDPGIECVAVLRPTKSRSLYAQMLGRGTRPLPGVVDGLDSDEDRTNAISESKKPGLLVIDVVGNSSRHDLVGPLDVLGGEVSDRVRQVAEELLDESDSEESIDDLLEEAERRVQEASEHEKQRRMGVVGVARYRVHDVLSIDPVAESALERGKPPTPRMLEVLVKAGVEGADEMGYARAKQVIGEIIRRREKGLCTYKQARLLKKHGFDTATMPFAVASEHIGRLMQGWRRATA